MPMIVAILFPLKAFAVWINATGKIEKLHVYQHTGVILVTLDTDGADVTDCSNKRTFAISSSVTHERRQIMLSVLMSAEARGKPVTLAYNDVGGCEPWDANASVYRKITRISF